MSPWSRTLRSLLVPFLFPVLFLAVREGRAQASLSCCRGIGALEPQGGFNSPTGEMIDYANDRLYVVDQLNQTLRIYTQAGVPVTTLSTWSGGGAFGQPTDVGVDGAGNIYVSDLTMNAVFKFDLDRNYLGTVNPIILPACRGVAVDPGVKEGAVYISNYWNNQWNVMRFDGSGATYSATATFGLGVLDTPSGLEVAGKWLYVTDSNHGQVVKYDTTQSNPSPVTVLGSLIVPSSVRTDLAGNFYVVEYGSSTLDVYDQGFTHLESQCNPPNHIWGVAVNENSKIFLSEIDPAPVTLFGVLPTPTVVNGDSVTILQGCVVQPTVTPSYKGANPPAPSQCFLYPSPVKGDQATLSYSMAGSGTMEMRIWNEKGELALQVSDQKAAGVQITPFSTASLVSGVYFYVVTLQYDSGRSEKIGPKKFAVLR